jgi:hypothetical protein
LDGCSICKVVRTRDFHEENHQQLINSKRGTVFSPTQRPSTQPSAGDADSSATDSAAAVAAGTNATSNSTENAFVENHSPVLLWKGGPIMSRAAITAIFWGPQWANESFVKDKIDGIGLLFGGINGSNYTGSFSEYEANGTRIGTNDITYRGHVVDLSSANDSTAADAPQFYAMLDKVCDLIEHPESDGQGFYPVFVDERRPANRSYCAYHTFSECRGVRVQFALIWNLDDDPSCDPNDSNTNHTQGLAAIANIAAHELIEALTDPKLDAWLDKDGWENADKCAWVFADQPLELSNGKREREREREREERRRDMYNPNMFLFAGSKWKLQMNWSNRAYAINSTAPCIYE